MPRRGGREPPAGGLLSLFELLSQRTSECYEQPSGGTTIARPICKSNFALPRVAPAIHLAEPNIPRLLARVLAEPGAFAAPRDRLPAERPGKCMCASGWRDVAVTLWDAQL